MMRRLLQLALPLLVLALAGCSGKPNDPNATDGATALPQSTQTLSGTVAAGAPLVGTVEVKDGLGARKQVQVSADGSYHLGLKGLSFPLLLRAYGQVGGHQVTLVSAATASDADGTVNVTPFTDLIVAKLARGPADAFFEQPDFTHVTDTLLDEARAMVTQVIAPVMTELQVDQSLDLRRTAFLADHTKLDAMLDVVKVRVDASSNRAHLLDVVNGTAVDIDLGSMDERVVLATPPQGSYGSAVADLQAIEQVLQQLNALFATALPDAADATLRSLFTDDFRHVGADLATFLSSAQLLAPGNVGLRLYNPVILARSSDGSSLRVAVQVQDTQGNVIAYDSVDADELLMRKGTDNRWRIAGDRRMGDVALSAVNLLQLDSLAAAGSVPPTVASQALEVWAPSAAGPVRHVQVSGPGLPLLTNITGLGQVAGVLLSRGSAAQPFTLTASDGSSTGSTWLQACPQSSGQPCADMGSIPAWATYTVRFLDANMQAIGEDTTVTLPAPPMAPADVSTQGLAWFALPSAVYPSSFDQLADGMALRLTWLAPASWDHVASFAGLAMLTDNAQVHASATVDGGHAQNLGSWAGAAPTAAPLMWTRVQGPMDRAFVSTVPYPLVSTGVMP